MKKLLLLMVVIMVVAFLPVISQAKDSDGQDQIILLNDSAAAIEDTNPDLSKALTKFADEREKEWEAEKNDPSTPTVNKNIPQIQEHIQLLKAAALVIEPTYPLIAKSLKRMAKDLNKTIELAQ